MAPLGYKEIGFAPVGLTDAGRLGPLCHLEGVPLLHWHGDAFEIPQGGDNLATTALCATQGFTLGPNILGLQCHPEVDAGCGIERWLIGHAAELAAAGIGPSLLREQAAAAALTLGQAAPAMLNAWLAGLRYE